MQIFPWNEKDILRFKQYGHEKANRGQLVWFICITSATMTSLLYRLCSANRFYCSKWGQEWVSSCPPAGVQEAPSTASPSVTDWTWSTEPKESGGIPFQQLGLPRDSSQSFCLIHLCIQKTQREHLPSQSRATGTQSSPEWTSCLLSFIKCLILSLSPFPHLCVCVHMCVCQTAVQPALSGGWPS